MYSKINLKEQINLFKYKLHRKIHLNIYKILSHYLITQKFKKNSDSIYEVELTI